MKVLLVEDDQDSVATYKSTVKRYSLEHSVEIETVYANTAEAAFEAIDGSFDGAIIDLKLDTDKEGGNKVITKIHEEYRIPIAVHTGTPSELDCKEPVYVGLYIRGEHGYDVILTDLFDVYNTGLTKILGGKGVMEDTLNKVFWNHLPDAISHWKEVDTNPETKEKQLLRYVLTHIQEILSLNNKGENDTINSAEVYIYPPIKKYVSEGVVAQCKTNEDLYIVLTPACDLSNCKADCIQLAEIKNLLTEESIVSKKSQENRKNVIKSFVDNKKGERFHFLPSFRDIPPSLIDFQYLHSVTFDEFGQHFNLLCSISPPFYKDIVNRFSAYYARQGSPDFETTNVVNDIADKIQESHPI